MLFFAVCLSIELYFLKHVNFQIVLLTLHSTLLANINNFTDNFFFVVFVFFIIFSFLGIRIFSDHEFHSLGPNKIIFRRTVPFSNLMHKFANLLDILVFLLFGDRYLVVQAVEITCLAREIMRYTQRPLFHENFQNTGVYKYEYEDISAYLKKCQQGAQEISINADGIVRVRRYVFGTSRRLNKAIEDTRSALIRMKGGLESLSFEVNSAIISEKDLQKLMLPPKFAGYGLDRSVLCVKQSFSKSSSYKRYISLIIIEGQPEHKAYGEMTQHDQFIRHCLTLQGELTFVTNFTSIDVNEQKLEQLIKVQENLC